LSKKDNIYSDIDPITIAFNITMKEPNQYFGIKIKDELDQPSSFNVAHDLLGFEFSAFDNSTN